MSVEIERKFLLKNDLWRPCVERRFYMKQGYIPTVSGTTVRLRIKDEQGFMTIKGKRIGTQRPEFEYEIPKKDAETMLETLCEHPLVEKFRYYVHFSGFLWEIDEFLGDNNGLILAEIELPEVNTVFQIPEWIDRDVSHLHRYYNANLRKHPYCSWTDSEKSGKDIIQ